MSGSSFNLLYRIVLLIGISLRLQTWKNNMTVANDAAIKPFKGEDYTCITFSPDLAKFKMDKLDDDIVGLMSRRAYDVAGSSRGVKVFLNGKKLPASKILITFVQRVFDMKLLVYSL